MESRLTMGARVVRPGEHLAVIAYRHGADTDDVWGAKANRRLRADRPGAHMLVAGDVVELPEKKHPPPIPIAIGAETRIVATIPHVPIELVLGTTGSLVTDEPWHIEANGEKANGTTTSDGKVSFSVRVTTRRVTLVLDKRGVRRELAIGGLDPADNLSGIAQRLQNLGLYHGPVIDTMSPDIAAAITELQRKRGLAPTGHLDRETRDAITTEHGS